MAKATASKPSPTRKPPIRETSKKSKVDVRTAAHMRAVSRVAEAYRLRGVYP
ncbi:MAG: hypothetical protein HYR85_06075 [Planctomycetes bacterium]|nr:hypothetical protein [Planctomycetota bacterium]MBI3846300.1 hypothetical protein [Planctomycetota bacterium]